MIQACNIQNMETALLNNNIKIKEWVNARIGDMKIFSLEWVEKLPTENISSTTIYIVKNTSSTEENNIYTEYVYKQDIGWEILGTVNTGSIDLENYYNKIEINELIEGINSKMRKYCMVGSDEANTGGWYKFASQTINGWGDTNVTFMITNTFGKYYSGILQLQIRANIESGNTVVSCPVLRWHTRIGFNADDIMIVIDGNSYTLYINKQYSQYDRIMAEIISESNVNTCNSGIELHNSIAPETEPPVATWVSRDGATVDAATTASQLTQTQLTNEDLNELRTINFTSYFARGDNEVINNPFGDGAAFSIDVYRSAYGYITQEILSIEGVKKLRLYSTWSETWSEWKTIAYGDEYLLLTGGKLTGILESQNIIPSEPAKYNIGEDTNPYLNVFSQKFAVRAGNSGVTYGALATSGLGTTETEGVGRLIVGNNIPLGTENNASGALKIYGNQSGCTNIYPGNNTDKNLYQYFPAESGTLALTSDISTHNVATDAHNDIRDLIIGLTDRLNAVANSDDKTLDELSEIVAYIKANRTLIESVTDSKVSVTDVINNLTTNVTTKPLSAAQGVILKGLIDSIETELGSHIHDEYVKLSGDNTLTGTLNVVNVIPSSSLGGNLGQSTKPFNSEYVKTIALRDGTSSQSYGALNINTVGTTDTVGLTKLALGNNVASGTASNAKGSIEIYGSNTKKTTINPSDTSGDIILTLPSATGTLALDNIATSNTAGLVKIGYSESGKNYAVKLDGNNKMYVNVPWTDNDTKYTHPTTSGNKHIPSGGAAGQVLQWSADGTAVWGDVPLTGGTLSGPLSVVYAGNQLKLVDKSTTKPFFIRNVDGHTYFLVGDDGGSSYNNLRPLRINNTDGTVTANNGLNIGVNNVFLKGVSTANTAYELIGLNSSNQCDVAPILSNVVIGKASSNITIGKSADAGSATSIMLNGSVWVNPYNNLVIKNNNCGLYGVKKASNTSYLHLIGIDASDRVSIGSDNSNFMVGSSMSAVGISLGSSSAMLARIGNSSDAFTYNNSTCSSVLRIGNNRGAGTGTSIYGQIVYLQAGAYLLSSKAISSTSDARLKNSEELLNSENEKTYKYIDLWDNMKPRIFKMNDEGENAKYQLGYFAQEVEESLYEADLSENDFNGLVKTIDDIVEDTGSEDFEDSEYFDVKYSLTYEQCAMLTDVKLRQVVNEIIPEMQRKHDEEISELRAMIASLQNEINKI